MQDIAPGGVTERVMYSSAPEPVISVRNLCIAFHKDGERREVVHNVSFDAYPGETVAIVGESGSGKSVTALSLVGLLPARRTSISGQILLNGRDLTRLDASAMRAIRGGEIGLIFQEPMTSLNPVMTIEQQLTEAITRHLGLHGSAARLEAIRLLERVRIPSPEQRMGMYPHELSGGMRQRVMIAIALAGRPKLLIADEPTTALDVTVQAEILALIRELQEADGLAVLFITHDMGVVAEMAQRTVVLYHGKTIEAGPTEAMFLKPEQPYTRILLSAVPLLGTMDSDDRPMRFPALDHETGRTFPMRDVPDTVVRDTAPRLQVRDLCRHFDLPAGMLNEPSRLHAVRHVSFDLRAGETLAIVGESGCGKSTTGRALMRMIEPTSGSVLIDGQEIIGLPARKFQAMRRHIQMVFQDPYASLDPRMNVGATITEALVAQKMVKAGEAKDIAADLLRRVGLAPDMASRFPHEFSGGQRQRICIARSLALKPSIIVADECVSALDASIKGQVVNLMLDLQESLKLAYLFISHDMAVVERISHRVAVMYCGEIVEIGPRVAIFGNPQHPYTQRLLDAIPAIDPAKRKQRESALRVESQSAVFPRNVTPDRTSYRTAGDGHLVKIERCFA